MIGKYTGIYFNSGLSGLIYYIGELKRINILDISSNVAYEVIMLTNKSGPNNWMITEVDVERNFNQNNWVETLETAELKEKVLNFKKNF